VEMSRAGSAMQSASNHCRKLPENQPDLAQKR
jgi:hypothetical protein